VRGLTLLGACAAAIFLVAYDGGSYGIIERTTIAVAVWWLVLLAVALGLAPIERVPRAAAAVGLLLAGFAAWTGASLAWAVSAERAFAELSRVTLYVGVFALVALLATRARATAWTAGLATGMSAVALLALASRLWPSAFPDAAAVEALFGATSPRLSYPLNYWNGLGIFTAIALPLLLDIAVSRRPTAVRGLALGVIPALAVVVYLTSSRGAVAVAVAGIGAFVALDRRRWQILGALGIAAAGGAVAVAVLRTHRALVDAPLTRAAEDQGLAAAAELAAVCLLTSAVYAAFIVWLPRGRSPSRLVRRLAAVGLAVSAVAAIVLSDPVERFEDFRRDPATASPRADRGAIEGHLLSTSGSGRWQQWSLAIDQFEAHPVAGGGAGSHEAWATRSPRPLQFTTQAHSLYLETLGELGVVGFVLVAAAFGVALAEGARRALRRRDPNGPTAALAAASFSFALALGVDWMWELTAVSIVGVALIALTTGAATATPAQPAARAAPAMRVVGVALAAAALALQVIPLLAELSLRESQAAAADGDPGRALSAARAARGIEPWAASPHLQQALVYEELGDLEDARGAIGKAIERDRDDWRLWLVSARIETKRGAIEVARRHLAVARMLNPRSRLLAPS
jgi:tetratricopeptide (TPR) repeat protein